MDPGFAQAGWSGHPVHMEYAGYQAPPFTSPPATPMTPMTPGVHHHSFHIPHQYELPAQFPSHAPPPPQYTPPPDYRLFALCQHLSQYNQERDPKFWWEEFMSEFFHEGATLVVEVDLGEGTRKFRMTRQWIPFYFKSFLENGVSSIHLHLGEGSSTYHQGLLEMEFHSAVMETHHSQPLSTKVCTAGALIVDFTLEEKPRIISWYFHINDHMEFVPRQNPPTSTEESGVLGNITCRGLLPATQKLLFEVGMMDYQESAATTTAPTVSSSSTSLWHAPPPPVPQLIAMPGHEGYQCDGRSPPLVPPAVLSHPPTTDRPHTNGHSLPDMPQLKLHTKPPGVISPTTSSKLPTSMMVATEAVLLADTNIINLNVGGDERTITKVHSVKQRPVEGANYSTQYSRVNGAWIKQEQLTH